MSPQEEMAKAVEILQGKPAPAAEAPVAEAKPAEPEAPVASSTASSAPAQSEKSEESPKASDLAARFAALSRREREITQREQAIKKAKTDFESAKALPLKDRLAKVGLSTADVLESIVNEGAPDTPEKKLAAIEARLAEQEKREQEYKKKEEAARIEGAINKFKGEIGDFVSKNADRFELIKGSAAEETVYATIELAYEQSGGKRVLSVEEACEMVEKHLEEQVDRWKDFKKVQTRLGIGQKEAKPESKTPTETPSVKKDTVTLTSQDAAAPKSSVVREMDEEDLLREASKLLKFSGGMGK